MGKADCKMYRVRQHSLSHALHIPPTASERQNPLRGVGNRQEFCLVKIYHKERSGCQSQIHQRCRNAWSAATLLRRCTSYSDLSLGTKAAGRAGRRENLGALVMWYSMRDKKKTKKTGENNLYQILKLIFKCMICNAQSSSVTWT